MINVSFDPARRLVRAQMSGLLSVQEVDQFSRDEQAAVRKMGLSSSEFLLLIEAEGDVVQTQEVMAAFHSLILHSELKAQRIAIVRTSALTMMQSKRSRDLRSGTEVFDNLPDAETWLLQSD